ncbi:hypothetical protein PENSPDRAFT_252465 [Peniophora sp. CONT]|nr:hypothetical protein PENSPDRAFT_252465 [Peniophora sp. CONT]
MGILQPQHSSPNPPRDPSPFPSRSPQEMKTNTRLIARPSHRRRHGYVSFNCASDAVYRVHRLCTVQGPSARRERPGAVVSLRIPDRARYNASFPICILVYHLCTRWTHIGAIRMPVASVNAMAICNGCYRAARLPERGELHDVYAPRSFRELWRASASAS